jgi:hypothetical protein
VDNNGNIKYIIMIQNNVMKILNQRKPDYLKIRYFPYYKMNSFCEIMLEEPNNDKLIEYAVTNGTVTRTECTEYSIKDTYVRMITNKDTGEKTREFFRKESRLFTVDGYDGFFVVEIYNICSDDDLPYITKTKYNQSSSILSTYRTKDFDINRFSCSHSDDMTDGRKQYVDLSIVIKINPNDRNDMVMNSLDGFASSLGMIKKLLDSD